MLIIELIKNINIKYSVINKPQSSKLYILISRNSSKAVS